MNDKKLKKLGNISAIILGILWIYLGLSKHFIKNYINIMIVLLGIVLIIFNIWILKDAAS